jgi:hypothetical protein
VLPNEQTVVHHIQPHPDGILLANSRCHWRPEGPEKNALVVNWDGEVVDRFTLGDGISNLQVSPNGTIWVGYFDEGIYGNYGWGGPGPEPVGSHGVVAFDPSGKILHRYDQRAAGTNWIDDVYAMNVAGDEDAWIYFYSSFPIVNMRGKECRVWKYGDGGAKTLVVRGDQVMLIGDYERRSLARTVQLLADGSTNLVEERILVDRSGTELRDVGFCGVGNRLYVFKGGAVLVVQDW